MSSPKFFRKPFAVQGDRAEIPDNLQPTGVVNFDSGWGIDYERDPATDPNAKDVERLAMNWLLGVVTENLRQYQIEGTYHYITPEQNNNQPYPYGKIARCLYNDGTGVDLYESQVDNNTSLPTDTTKWAKVSIKNLVPITRKIIAGGALTGGGTLDQDVTISANFATGVPITRKIATTIPLTGGGDLTLDRILAINTATTAAIGAVALATTAEVTAGTNNTKAVTPAGLAAGGFAVKARKINTTAPLTGGGDLSVDRTLAISRATTAALGATVLATPAQVTAGTDNTVAVTPYSLKQAGIGVNNFSNTVTFNASTTWTSPITGTVFIEAIGGGGAGCTGTNNYQGLTGGTGGTTAVTTTTARVQAFGGRGGSKIQLQNPEYPSVPVKGGAGGGGSTGGGGGAATLSEICGAGGTGSNGIESDGASGENRNSAPGHGGGANGGSGYYTGGQFGGGGGGGTSGFGGDGGAAYRPATNGSGIGSGGGGALSGIFGGGGGGGGGFKSSGILHVSKGQTLTIIIGAGGIAPPAPQTGGDKGGDGAPGQAIIRY